MRILDVAITHPDGRITDTEGRRLSFDEAYLAREYRDPEGRDMFDRAYEFGVRMRKRQERRFRCAFLGQTFDRDCRDLVEGRVS